VADHTSKNWYRPKLVELVEYDFGWPDRYEAEAALILEAAGSRAVAIEHVGSTAVPGMDAKPIIDLLLAVDDLEHFAPLIGAVGQLGYVSTDELHAGVPGRRVLRKGPVDFAVPRTHHLHVTLIGSDYWNHLVWFRDRLRRDERVADAYVELKRKLQEEFECDPAGYATAKAAFVLKWSGPVR
jgi:GrpB-like predicted nucleotidyltransferase (UPF0157 family)